MDGKGYTSKAHHLRIIRNWRCACDEQGLAGSQRSLYNNEFLEYLFDDLMPWHRNGLRDFSLSEVNRYDDLLMVFKYINNTLTLELLLG